MKYQTHAPLVTDIRNDFLAENNETFALSVSFIPPKGIKKNANCNDELEYFCDHTILIVDDDG